MKIKLGKDFGTRFKGRFGKYSFQVGVLEDASYKKPAIGKRGLHGEDVLTNYAGVKVRKKSNVDSGMAVSDISKSNRDRMGFNYLTKPFEKKTSAIIQFTNSFFKLAFGKSEQRRCENLLQAIVRNPMLRGDYGPNSALTKKIKGFDRYMIDTAQLFKAITAKCVVK